MNSNIPPIPFLPGVPDELVRVLRDRFDRITPGGGTTTVVRSPGGSSAPASASYGYVVETPDGSNSIAPDAGDVCHEVTLVGASAVLVQDPTAVVAGKPLVLIVVQNGTTPKVKPAFSGGYLGIPAYDVSAAVSSVTIFHFVGVSDGIVRCVGLWQGSQSNSWTLVPAEDSSDTGTLVMPDLYGTAVTLRAPKTVNTAYSLRPPADPPSANDQVIAAKTHGVDTETKWVTIAGGTAPTPDGLISASFTVLDDLYGASAAFALAGTIDLPADLTHLDRIRIDVIGPSPGTALHSFFVDGPFSGSTATFWIGANVDFLKTSSAQAYTIRFVAISSGAQQEATPYATTFNVPAAGIASVVLVEWDGDGGAVRQAFAGVNSTRLDITINLSGPGPVWAPIRYNRANGLGWYDLGWHRIDTTGAVVRTDWLPAPSEPDLSWTGAAEVILGIEGQSTLSGFLVPALTASWVESTAQPINSVGAPENNIASAATIGTVKYDALDGGYIWTIDQVTWNVDLSNPRFYSTKLTAQRGHYVGGVWTPATGGNDQEVDIGVVRWDGGGSDYASLSVSGSVGTVVMKNTPPPSWGIPARTRSDGSAEVDIIFKLRIYVGSVEGASETSGVGGGTWTVQTTCWSGASSFDVTPIEQPGNLDSTRLIGSTLGTGLRKNPTTGKTETHEIPESSISSVPLVAVREKVAQFLGVGLDIIDDLLRIPTASIDNTLIAFQTVLHSNIALLEVYNANIAQCNFTKMTGNQLTLDAGGLNVLGGAVSFGVGLNPVTLSLSGLVMWDSSSSIYMAGLISTGGAITAGSYIYGSSYAQLASYVDAAGGFRVNGTPVIDGSRNAAFANMYTSSEVDTLLAAKANSSALDSYYTKTAADARYLPIGGNPSNPTGSMYWTDPGGYWHVLGVTNGLVTSLSEGPL